MIRTPPQHQTDPDKQPGQVVHSVPGNYSSERLHGGTNYAPESEYVPPTIYKPAHGGYPGEVKAR